MYVFPVTKKLLEYDPTYEYPSHLGPYGITSLSRQKCREFKENLEGLKNRFKAYCLRGIDDKLELLRIETTIVNTYIKISTFFANKDFWKKLHSFYPGEAAAIRRHSRWLKHARYAHYASETLLDVAAILARFKKETEEAMEEASPSWLASDGNRKFCLDYKKYLQDRLKAINKERMTLCRSMIARLLRAHEQKDFTDGDILSGLVGKVYELVIQQGQAPLSSEETISMVTYHQFLQNQEKQFNRSISEQQFNEFVQYICMIQKENASGLGRLKYIWGKIPWIYREGGSFEEEDAVGAKTSDGKLGRASPSTKTSDLKDPAPKHLVSKQEGEEYTILPINLELITVAETKKLVAVPARHEIRKLLEEWSNLPSSKKSALSLYFGPTSYQLAKYYYSSCELQSYLRALQSIEKYQETIKKHQEKFKEYKETVNLETIKEAAEFRKKEMFKASRFESYFNPCVEFVLRILAALPTEKLSQIKIRLAWISALEQGIADILSAASDKISDFSFHLKGELSFDPNSILTLKTLQAITKFLNALTTLNESKVAWNETFQKVQKNFNSLKEQIYERVIKLILEEKSTYLNEWIEYLQVCTPTESNALLFDLFACGKLPKNVVELQQEIVKLAPKQNLDEDTKQKILNRLLNLIIQNNNRRKEMVLFLQSLDKSYVEQWDAHWSLPALRAKNNLQDLLAIENPSVFQFQKALDALAIIQNYFEPPDALRELLESVGSFLKKYLGKERDWHPFFEQIQAAEIRELYFAKRLNFLLIRAKEDAEILIDELDVFKKQCSEGLRESFSKIVFHHFSDPLTPLHKTLPKKYAQELFDFLMPEAALSLAAIIDAFAISQISLWMQDLHADSLLQLSRGKQLSPNFGHHPNTREKIDGVMVSICKEPWLASRAVLVDELFPADCIASYRLHWFECFLRNPTTTGLVEERDLDSLEGLKRFFGERFGDFLDAMVRWLENPTNHQLIMITLASFLKEKEGIYSKKEFSGAELRRYEQAQREFQELQNFISSCQSIIKCLDWKNFDIFERQLRAQLDLISYKKGQEKPVQLFKQFILKPLIEQIKLRLGDSEKEKEDLLDEIAQLAKVLPTSDFFNEMTFILTHAEQIYQLNMRDLLSEMNHRGAKWMVCFQGNTLDLVLRGFTLQNLTKLRKTLMRLNIAEMSSASRLAWCLLTELLLLTPEERDSERGKEKIASLKKLIKTQVEPKKNPPFDSWQDLLISFLYLVNPKTESQKVFTLTCGIRGFNPNIEKQFFDFNNWLHLGNGSYIDIEVPVGKLTDKLKVIINPPTPGFELAIQSFYRLSLDSNTPYVELIKIPLNTPKGLSFYPALLIKKNSDETLPQFWRQGKILQWDKATFDLRFILTLMIGRENGHPENFWVVTDSNKPNGWHDLYCCNSGRPNTSPFFIETTSLSSSKRQGYLGIREIMFCFDEILMPFDSGVIEKFLSLDLKEFVQVWLVALCQINEGIIDMNEEIFETLSKMSEANPSLELPTEIPEDLVESLCQRLFQMRKFLQQSTENNTNVSPFGLLSHIYPKLATYYGKVLSEQLSPLERFERLEANSVEIEVVDLGNGEQRIIGEIDREHCFIDKTSWLTQPKVNPRSSLNGLEAIFSDFERVEQAMEALLKKNNRPFRNLPNDSLRERVIQQIDLKVLPLEIQEFVLQAMEGVSFKGLNFEGSQALTARKLLAILSSCKELIKLNIRNCQGLLPLMENATDLLLKVSQACPTLRDLDLSGIQNLASIHNKLPFKDLRYLNLSGCHALRLLSITAPLLHWFEAKNCPDLFALHLDAPNLKIFKVSDCVKLRSLFFTKEFSIEHILNGKGYAALSGIPYALALAPLGFTTMKKSPAIPSAFISTLTTIIVQEGLYFDQSPPDSIDLAGCAEVKHVSFFKKFPFLIDLPLNELNADFVEVLESFLDEKIVAGTLSQEFKQFFNKYLKKIIGRYLAITNRFCAEIKSKNEVLKTLAFNGLRFALANGLELKEALRQSLEEQSTRPEAKLILEDCIKEGRLSFQATSVNSPACAFYIPLALILSLFGYYVQKSPLQLADLLLKNFNQQNSKSNKRIVEALTHLQAPFTTCVFANSSQPSLTALQRLIDPGKKIKDLSTGIRFILESDLKTMALVNKILKEILFTSFHANEFPLKKAYEFVLSIFSEVTRIEAEQKTLFCEKLFSSLFIVCTFAVVRGDSPSFQENFIKILEGVLRERRLDDRLKDSLCYFFSFSLIDFPAWEPILIRMMTEASTFKEEHDDKIVDFVVQVFLKAMQSGWESPSSLDEMLFKAAYNLSSNTIFKNKLIEVIANRLKKGNAGLVQQRVLVEGPSETKKVSYDLLIKASEIGWVPDIDVLNMLFSKLDYEDSTAIAATLRILQISLKRGLRLPESIEKAIEPLLNHPDPNVKKAVLQIFEVRIQRGWMPSPSSSPSFFKDLSEMMDRHSPSTLRLEALQIVRVMVQRGEISGSLACLVFEIAQDKDLENKDSKIEDPEINVAAWQIYIQILQKSNPVEAELYHSQLDETNLKIVADTFLASPILSLQDYREALLSLLHEDKSWRRIAGWITLKHLLSKRVALNDFTACQVLNIDQAHPAIQNLALEAFKLSVKFGYSPDFNWLQAILEKIHLQNLKEDSFVWKIFLIALKKSSFQVVSACLADDRQKLHPQILLKLEVRYRQAFPNDWKPNPVVGTDWRGITCALTKGWKPAPGFILSLLTNNEHEACQTLRNALRQGWKPSKEMIAALALHIYKTQNFMLYIPILMDIKNYKDIPIETLRSLLDQSENKASNERACEIIYQLGWQFHLGSKSCDAFLNFLEEVSAPSRPLAKRYSDGDGEPLMACLLDLVCLEDSLKYGFQKFSNKTKKQSAKNFLVKNKKSKEDQAKLVLSKNAVQIEQQIKEHLNQKDASSQEGALDELGRAAEAYEEPLTVCFEEQTVTFIYESKEDPILIEKILESIKAAISILDSGISFQLRENQLLIFGACAETIEKLKDIFGLCRNRK